MENSEIKLTANQQVSHRWEKIAVFVFGVIFISVLLVVVFSKDLTAQGWTVMKIVMALAVAGVGVCIPGFLDVQFKGFIRAGGAMGLFVIVFFFSPAPPHPIPVPPQPTGVIPDDPPVGPENTIDSWLKLLDNGQFSQAWQTCSKNCQAAYNLSSFLQVSQNQRAPLGQARTRSLTSMSDARQLPNGRQGNFRYYSFYTVFSSGLKAREDILVEVEDGGWKVYQYVFNTILDNP